ncbi:MAG TPA: hypothetical protein VFT98_04705 [Myxococcota bacterium]|nr:hypothetical protein [Myxococcota bacterium]
MRNESFFANPSFRVHLLFVTAAFTAAFLAISAAVIFVPLFQRFDAGVASPDEMLRLTGEILEVHARYWPVALISLLSSIACSWILYGRMRGPLFRFVEVFRAISTGRTPRDVVIRATDYVQDECAELNKMLSALRAHTEALERVELQVASISDWAAANGDSQLMAIADELEAQCKALRVREAAGE